jgi:hypothetical protein
MMIDKTQWPFSDPDLVLHDLGHDVYWSKVCDADDNWIGILEWHECGAQNATDAGVSAGGVNFENAPADVKGPRWQKLSGDDEGLTIVPSVLCRTCGLHGWIRDGKWVIA